MLTSPGPHVIIVWQAMLLSHAHGAALAEKTITALLDGTHPIAHTQHSAADAPPIRQMHVGFGRQLRALYWRSSVHNRRHPAFIRAMASRSVTMACIMGYLYSGLDHSQASVQDRTGVLYFVLTNQVTHPLPSPLTDHRSPSP